eukprot:155463-Rhodomonas_salina.1
MAYAMLLCRSYAESGTDIGYAPMHAGSGDRGQDPEGSEVKGASGEGKGGSATGEKRELLGSSPPNSNAVHNVFLDPPPNLSAKTLGNWTGLPKLDRSV